MKTCDFPRVSQNSSTRGAFLRLKRWAILSHPYGMKTFRLCWHQCSHLLTQYLPQRGQHEVHVANSGAVAHEADAPGVAGHGTQPRANLNPILR